MSLLLRLLRHEAASGVLLILAAVAALIAANSPAAEIYRAALAFPQNEGGDGHHFSVLLVINDALMALFFLMIGLEVKRELIQGALASRAKAVFPAIAALGGMVAPAIIYTLVNWEEPANHVGWAIPTATDIAFAVGVLALLGKRVPPSLKAFLLALAIIDDLGAIVIIALFYNSHLSLPALAAAAGLAAILALMNRANIRRIALYLPVGALLWVCVLLSGIHATLAGVVVGALIPLNLPRQAYSPALVLEHALQPWVIYLILPLFAFANAGVPLQGLTPGSLFELLPAGIAGGLVLGKPIGILVFCLLAIRLGLARLPDGVTVRQIAAAAVLCGIGFTMSIFIAGLAFGGSVIGEEKMDLAKLGILSGSVIAAVAGYLALRSSLPAPAEQRET
ncbi:Na+/H+ antiporter NhaA [Martelella alba]|uniref:Na(+)/H(+) antiporter NhaA n=1 Tax=Martelella alba TaxID=2590451 RepID=A0ABY2SS49_9HYPH|nr:Na+/H+ antiporter NhaA [Martelella alba]TKI08710.1 Na+/H+ antiporter NhaA [Martelella alba]